jgi:pyruvate/2-oxoglutarate/acetoin dehydrogenase E1 component
VTTTVEQETAQMNIATALNSALDTAMELDEKVIVLGEDVADPAGGVLKVTKGLSTKYGVDRVRSTPIAEQAIVGAAIGAALAGYKAVAEVMFMDFTAVCLDQIVNHAAKLRYMSGGASTVPLTIRTSIGTQRFGAQHTQSLEAWFMHVPGIKVVMPSAPADAKGLLASCIHDEDPCLFIENFGMAFAHKEQVPVGDHRVPLGKAAVKRKGNHVTVITYGAAVHTALEAAEVAAGEGINLEVIDLRTLVPLDLETILESVGRNRRAIVLHDATTFCGPGAEIAARINEDLFEELLAPVQRIGAAYAPAAYAPSGLGFLPTVEDVVDAAKRITE